MDSHSDHDTELSSGHRRLQTRALPKPIFPAVHKTASHTSANALAKHSNPFKLSPSLLNDNASKKVHSPDCQNENWKVDRRNPFLMTTFLLLGTTCSIAHHVYYESLDRSSSNAVNQEWSLRIGIGLAFLARAFLVASAAMGFQHYSWLILRNTSLSINAIDDLLGILVDLVPLINIELWRSTLGVTIVACVIW